MLKKALVSFLFLMLLFGPLFTLKAQNNVGIGTLSPSSDAILDLFSNNKGFLTPRVTSAERATIPANSSGLLVFDTDENKFFYWNSALSLWQVMDDFSNTNELIQVAAFDETTKQITLTDRGATYTLDLNILSQQLSFRNDTLSISDKNEIDLGIYNNDSSATNELQSLTTSNDTIFIDRRGFIKLSEDEFWNTDGNAGTTPLTHFIGTTDNQDLIIRTDSIERVRILGPNGNFGIGTTTPEEKLDVEGNIELEGQIRIKGGAPGVGKVLTSSDAVGLATWQDVPVVENGLNKNINTIRLGGPLVENTTIKQADNDLNIDVDGTGTFNVMDNGVPHFRMNTDGTAAMGGDVFFRQTNATSGTVLGSVTADGDKGQFRLMDAGANQHIIEAASTTVFNELGNDLDFRIESDNDQNLLFIAGGNDRIGIGTTTPEEKLDVEGNIELEGQIRIKGGAPGVGKVLTSSDAVGLATWQDVPVVENGLNKNINTIRLGGPLVENTTITQGAFKIEFDQTTGFGSTGDFTINSQGVPKFRVNAWGDTRFGSDVYFMDESVGGQRLVQITDQNDDGRIRIFENGVSSVDLNAGNSFTFNLQRFNRNFVIKSVGNENMFFLDASDDRVGIGTSSPSSQLDLTEQIRIRGGNPGNGKVLTSDANGLATWQNGIPDVNNGLYVNNGANRIRLGGPLVENTTITQGAFGMNYNLNGSGDFNIQDNGINKFSVRDNGDVQMDATTFYLDESTNRVGIGMSSPDETLDVEGSARFGIDGKLTINSRTTGLERDRIDGFLNTNGQFASYGPEIVALQTTIDDKKIGYDVSTYGGGDIRHILSLQPDGGRVGIGTMTASSQLELTEQITIRGGNPGNGKVLTSDANGLATWQNGIPDVNNGLYVNNGANRIRLGGPLVENTTITQGAFGMNYNLNGSGDFNIQDNGINKFSVRDNGDVQMDATTFYLDESTNRVGVGTTAPGQTLDVNGVIRLKPETSNPGNVPIQNLTVDAQGDVNTGSLTLNTGDGISMNLGGFVIKTTAPKTVDLPGPIANYTVIANLKFYSFCDNSTQHVNIYFKRYANSTHSFSHSLNTAALTETNSSSFTTRMNISRCGVADLKVTIDRASNTLTFELINVSGTFTGGYVVPDNVNWFKAI